MIINVRRYLLTSTYYRPWPNLLLTTPKSEVHMLCIAIWGGVTSIDLDLTSTYYICGCAAHYYPSLNEYFYHSNSMNRSRDKNLDAYYNWRHISRALQPDATKK